MIVEYCRFGNLHNYLLRHRTDFINQIDPATDKFDPTIGLDLLTRSVSVSSNNRFAFVFHFHIKTHIIIISLFINILVDNCLFYSITQLNDRLNAARENENVYS